MKPEQKTLVDKLDINNDETAAILERRDTVYDAEETKDVAEASTGRKTAVMIACLYMHICAYGLPTALGVVYAELISALEVPRYQAALVQSLCMGMSFVGGVFMTGPIRTFGSGICVILASVVGTVAMMVTFFATNIQTIIVSIGVISGLALSVLLLTGFVAVSQIFTTHKKVALAALTLGANIGQASLPNVTEILIYMYNWNGAFLVLSAIVMLNCVPCGVILWCSKQYLSSEVSKEIKRTQTWRHCAWIRDIAFVMFIVTVFFSRIVFPIQQFFIVDLAVMKGFSLTEGAGLLSINGLFSIIGRVILTLALKFLPNTASDLHLGYGFVLSGLGNFLVLYASTYWAIVLAIIAHGVCTGIVLSIMPVMKMDIRGPELFVESMAILHVVIGLGNVLGGSLGGLSVDLTGSYALVYYIATAVLVLCGFSMAPIYLIRKRKQELGKTNGHYQELK